MKILKIKESNGVLVMSVSGFVDASNVDEFKKEVDIAIESKNSRIVLDFSTLDYINSSGFGVLLDARERTMKVGGEVKILNLPSKIENLFRILGFTHLFATYKDRDQAVSSFSGQA
jgi:anti-anti-sigma factor